MRTLSTLVASLALALSSVITAQAQETKAGPVKVSMETSKGTIELELDGALAPITVKNFVSYAKKGHFDGTIFHRVIPGFVIQGGGFTAAMEQKPTDAPIKNEASNGLKNTRGTICMARTSDLDSATSQFFINLKDNASLDYGGPLGGYAVFGKVTKGLEVVDAIAATPTGTKVAPSGQPFGDVPSEDIVIKSVKVSE